MKPAFNKSNIFYAGAFFLLAVSLLLVGCATSGESKTGPVPPLEGISTPPAFGEVTFEHEMGAMGEVIRAYGAKVGGGIVLMSGLEERMAQKVSFKGIPYQEAVAVLAGMINCDYIHTGHYFAILPAEYRTLQYMNVREQMGEPYKAVSASVAFGAKTELFKVFSILGKSLDITIIADNYIAEARCGEIFLSDSPLPVVLEAILQSARISPESFTVESTPEYIFIKAVKNKDSSSCLLNPSSLTAQQKTLLDTSVSLFLPDVKTVEQAPFLGQPILLEDALRPLTEQLGVEIVAQRKLAEIPINPCVMNHVRLETALNLLLRQWPLPDFGFEVQENRILIRAK